MLWPCLFGENFLQDLKQVFKRKAARLIHKALPSPVEVVQVRADLFPFPSDGHRLVRIGLLLR